MLIAAMSVQQHAVEILVAGAGHVIEFFLVYMPGPGCSA